MAHYSIKELEHLSGIKAHTIRIWEQRYSILSPKRTDTNIRFYDDADLKTLLNVSLLNERGFKISKIAKMCEEQISEKVQELCENQHDHMHHINTLVTAMIDMDENRFEKTLSTVTLQVGLVNTMIQVIYPFLNKIGVLWQTGNISPAHEHFVSNLIRQKLIVAIDGQVVQAQVGAPTYLLYLPEGELHELALLFMNFIIRAHNLKVIYLGQNLPFEDLKISYQQCKPDFICTVLTSAPVRDQVQEYIDRLSGTFPTSNILLYGYLVQNDQLKLPQNVKRLNSIHDFISLIG